jgi:hypothetical protein
VIEEITEQPVEEVVENKVEQPRDEKGQFKSKFESAGDDSVVKVDLSKPPPSQSEEVKEESTEEKENVVEEKKEEVVEEVKEEEVVEETKEELPVIEEITMEDLKDSEVVEERIEEAIAESETTGKPLPENIQKLVDFMDETGGDIQDYVNLNRDVTKMDDSDVLDEYYRATKSHLTAEERGFLLEDTFGVDEDVDDERTIRKKKIALKEQVAEAKAYLDGQKSKYYEDIKAGSKLTNEQQKAIDFFNRYNKESENQKKLSEASKLKFQQKTDSVFNKEFKGFEYNVGDKKYRFNVKDVDKVKTNQSDINNFVNKFVSEDKSTIEDAKGYHKSLFTAMNADAIAKHFYEQGKADATKARVAKDKNINTEPRKSHGETNVSGVKWKVVGDSSSDIKNRSFKIRKKN